MWKRFSYRYTRNVESCMGYDIEGLVNARKYIEANLAKVIPRLLYRRRILGSVDALKATVYCSSNIVEFTVVGRKKGYNGYIDIVVVKGIYRPSEQDRIITIESIETRDKIPVEKLSEYLVKAHEWIQ